MKIWLRVIAANTCFWRIICLPSKFLVSVAIIAQKVEALARQAVTHPGVEAHSEKIVDRAEYPKYGLLYTPGLVIDNK
jgi:hypothetical protein